MWLRYALSLSQNNILFKQLNKLLNIFYFPRMAKRISLKDIAQAVGVSTALVSYVLNNKKENRISKEVAQRIRKAAQDLNYQPNQIAQSLKTNKTRTMGLVVADIGQSVLILTGPYYWRWSHYA